MNMVLRFFKELFNSRLKCERVGHNEKETKIKIRMKDPDRWGLWVVVDYYRHSYKCKRCGEATKPDFDTYIEGFSKCSMPSYMWDEMREKGFTII